MKTLCLCASLLFYYSAKAAPWAPSLITCPIRKIGETTYDLRPLFQYWTNPAPRQIRPPLLTNFREHKFRVHQVFSDGLLVAEEDYLDRDDGRVCILRNHPRQAELVDRDLTYVLAAKLPERAQYRTISGGTATVDQYDFGQCLDLAEYLKQKAAEKNK